MGSTKAPASAPPNIDKPWLLPQQTNYRFINAKLVDTVEGKIVENTTISLSMGRICSVNQGTPADDDEDDDAVVVDLQGLFLCPGLIDAHVHVTATPGEQGLKNTYKNISQSMNNFRTTYVVKEMLARGFTTVRDCGGADGALKDAIAEWLIVGPRLVIAGHALSQTGGHGDQRAAHEDEDPTTRCCAGHKSGISRLCDGSAECMVAVRDEIRKGADFVKIMAGGGVSSRLNNLAHAQFLPEELSAIVRTAALFDTYVTAHAYSNRAMRHAVEHGVRGIEHGNFLDQETAEYMASKNVRFHLISLIAEEVVPQEFEMTDCGFPAAGILHSDSSHLPHIDEIAIRPMDHQGFDGKEHSGHAFRPKVAGSGRKGGTDNLLRH